MAFSFQKLTTTSERVCCSAQMPPFLLIGSSWMFGPGVGDTAFHNVPGLYSMKAWMCYTVCSWTSRVLTGGLQQEGVNPSSVDLRDASRNVPGLNRFDLIATVSTG